MTSEKILIVEDDLKLQEMLGSYLSKQGFEVNMLADGSKAQQVIADGSPDLVLLDLMLPGLDGLTICRQIRQRYQGKLLMLTASDDDFNHVAALELGMDDFLVKPVKPQVLLAHIRMLLRRETALSAIADDGVIIFGALRLNKQRKQCELNGQQVPLNDSEFDLLLILAESPDRVLSRDVLTQKLRGIEYDGLDRTVDNKIMVLRRKLGDETDPHSKIITIRGKGYLFVPDAWY